MKGRYGIGLYFFPAAEKSKQPRVAEALAEAQKSRRCVKIPKNESAKAKSFKLLLLASKALPRSQKALAVAKRRWLISLLDKSDRSSFAV